jgi:hypothetical protein
MILTLFLIVSMALAHGPKGHSGVEFTALQAAQKGFELYDRLVSTGKLKESWETDLTNIEVFTRPKGNNQEIVVKFSRSKGEPQSVYIFFSEKGDYKGSNFTGK